MSTEHVLMSDETVTELNELKDDEEQNLDEVVSRLIDEHKKRNLLEMKRETLENDEFVPLEEV